MLKTNKTLSLMIVSPKIDFLLKCCDKLKTLLNLTFFNENLYLFDHACTKVATQSVVR